MFEKFICCCVCIVVCLYSCHQPPKSTAVQQVHGYVRQHLDSLSTWLSEEFIPLLDDTANADGIRRSFLKGRKHYKTIEFAVEYFFPNSARGINGPPLPEIEAEEHTVLEPGGFQVMEELLYPLGPAAALTRESKKMKSLLVRLEVLWKTLQFRDDQLFDALRMECFRIITLGIAGFDTPVSFASITEVPVALKSLEDVVNYFDSDKAHALKKLLRDARLFAEADSNFDSFDRLHFITRYMNPVSGALLDFQKSIQVPLSPNIYAINSGIRTLFDSGAFNPNYFTPDVNSYLNERKISLGKKIFFDPRLSPNEKVSCASCHIPAKAFTDGLTKNSTFSGDGLLPRNTPTLLNAGLQKHQFYDMRSVFLEDQVKAVIENKDEIHGNLQDAVHAFKKDSLYRNEFRETFGHDISQRDVQVALASYVRSLTVMDSRFDRFMHGDTTQLMIDERAGFNLFMGKAKCGTCHFLPLFNGTVPPAFMFTESEVIGVPADAKGKHLDADEGRYGVYAIDNFKHAFKTPSIRNITLTAPYMHNGVFATLEEVMDFYNRGGGNGIGLQVSNQTLPFDSLSLSTSEMKKVIAFMGALTEVSYSKNKLRSNKESP